MMINNTGAKELTYRLNGEKGTIMKANMKKYGNEITHLTLTEKAQSVYSVTDPLEIYELPDGSYRMTGSIEADNLTEQDVNDLLEELYAEDIPVIDYYDGHPVWYALQNNDQDDWGTGTWDHEEACRMCESGEFTQIVHVAEGKDPVAIKVERF